MVSGTKKVYIKTKQLKKTRKAKKQAQKASTIEAVYFPIEQQVEILRMVEPENPVYKEFQQQLKFTRLTKNQRLLVKKHFEFKVIKHSNKKITSGYWFAKQKEGW